MLTPDTHESLATPPIDVAPPLKWAGGKRWLVPTVARFWQGAQPARLVEPFVGGMAVALGLLPSAALLNDANTI